MRPQLLEQSDGMRQVLLLIRAERVPPFLKFIREFHIPCHALNYALEGIFCQGNILCWLQ
jgi:hypothetical protein